MNPIIIEDFFSLRGDCCVLDVRSPSEFDQGHIVGAKNLPLFSDEERATVGTLYKHEGKIVAVEKGLKFVGPKLARFTKTARKFSEGKPIILYCARGGMRSHSMAWLFSTVELDVRVLSGGYKAYRQHFESLLPSSLQLRILAGPTGSGKTEILQAMAKRGQQVLDLEALAVHRGSAFGGFINRPQPSTEIFINLIHEELLKMDLSKPIWVENESRTIGKVFIPDRLWEIMCASPLVYIDVPRMERVERILKDYGDDNIPQDWLIDSFMRIAKRLGPQETTKAVKAVERGDLREAIEIALIYYDKGYADSTAKQKSGNITSLTFDHSNSNFVADQLIKMFNT